jgi:hypothetical protein
MNRKLAMLALAACPPAALGQHVVPSEYQGSAGTGSFLLLSIGGRSYQWIIHEDQLAAVLGHEIKGIAWRALPSALAAWPPSSANFTSFDLYLGPSVAPANRSTTFANNYAGPPVQVRSGPLMIEAGAFPFGGSPNAFGPAIMFDQPYVYKGGNLFIELRHTGYTGGSNFSVDALTSTTPGHLDQFAAQWGSGYTSTGGSNGNFAILSLRTEPSQPCYPNCDGSTTEPILNVADFTCFLTKFAAGNAYANCDGSTVEPVLNVADFTCFLTKFAAGCS